ncbi:hypothetical protein CBR_g35023 [Chara braunii]|uniref:Uncharacterized protein n=1 Tax=Chara braunii TaxID=69332 RepID=A0A388LK53_CHABU|nr:hypothetical protein CBR_g35023 [Chara braunii]|eukprot:GBG82657.1 hypothetical protein CBR_g35023 [Chara braunii]
MPVTIISLGQPPSASTPDPAATSPPSKIETLRRWWNSHWADEEATAQTWAGKMCRDRGPDDLRSPRVRLGRASAMDVDALLQKLVRKKKAGDGDDDDDKDEDDFICQDRDRDQPPFAAAVIGSRKRKSGGMAAAGTPDRDADQRPDDEDDDDISCGQMKRFCAEEGGSPPPPPATGRCGISTGQRARGAKFPKKCRMESLSVSESEVRGANFENAESFSSGGANFEKVGSSSSAGGANWKSASHSSGANWKKAESCSSAEDVNNNSNNGYGKKTAPMTTTVSVPDGDLRAPPRRLSDEEGGGEGELGELGDGGGLVCEGRRRRGEEGSSGAGSDDNNSGAMGSAQGVERREHREGGGGVADHDDVQVWRRRGEKGGGQSDDDDDDETGGEGRGRGEGLLANRRGQIGNSGQEAAGSKLSPCNRGEKDGHVHWKKEVRASTTTTTGPGVQASTSDRATQASTTGPGIVQASTSDPATQASTTGPDAQASTTGPGVQASPTGRGVQASTTGCGVQSSTTGRGVQASTTGRAVQSSTTGRGVQAFTTGPARQVSTTGRGVQASTTGPAIQESTTGRGVQASTTGPAVATDEDESVEERRRKNTGATGSAREDAREDRHRHRDRGGGGGGGQGLQAGRRMNDHDEAEDARKIYLRPSNVKRGRSESADSTATTTTTTTTGRELQGNRDGHGGLIGDGATPLPKDEKRRRDSRALGSAIKMGGVQQEEAKFSFRGLLSSDDKDNDKDKDDGKTLQVGRSIITEEEDMTRRMGASTGPVRFVLSSGRKTAYGCNYDEETDGDTRMSKEALTIDEEFDLHFAQMFI